MALATPSDLCRRFLSRLPNFAAEINKNSYFNEKIFIYFYPVRINTDGPPGGSRRRRNASKTIPMKKEKRREHELCKQGMETQEKYWLGIG
ncbi:MAG: hypothetical protein Q4C37_04725 [Bacteroidales bacterium]|nr:hypothetical protein [Bacteroidales bacterium]